MLFWVSHFPMETWVFGFWWGSDVFDEILFLIAFSVSYEEKNCSFMWKISWSFHWFSGNVSFRDLMGVCFLLGSLSWRMGNVLNGEYDNFFELLGWDSWVFLFSLFGLSSSLWSGGKMGFKWRFWWNPFIPIGFPGKFCYFSSGWMSLLGENVCVLDGVLNRNVF